VCEHTPYLILPVRQLSSEPFGSRRSVRRSAEPKRYTSELSGKMPDPSQSERSAEAPRASRRQYAGPVSIRTIRRSTDTPKRGE